MWSHLTFNLLRYKLLHPFYRRRIRGWEGKNLALDLTFGTCSGQNSSTTIFPPSRLPLHHRSLGTKDFPSKGKAWLLTSCQLLPNPLLGGEWRQGLWIHLMEDSLPWHYPSVCMITPSSPCFRASPLTRFAFLEVYQVSLWSLAEQHLKESPWFPLESPGRDPALWLELHSGLFS